MFSRLFLLVYLVCPTPGANAQDTSDAQWLLDYGRAHALAAPDPRPTDAEYILVWIDAALNRAPDLWEAHRWKSDLLARLGRTEEAIESLTQYCDGQPQDAPAIMNLLTMQIADKQKVEDRISLCNTFLARPRIPTDAASDIHLFVANLLENRGDHDEALTHVRQAIELSPHNPAATRRMYEYQGQLDSPEAQVDLMLQSAALNPGDPQPAWTLATALKGWGLYDQTQAWLTTASDIWSNATGNQPIPPDLQIEFAELCQIRSEHAEAITKAMEVLERTPQFAPASFVIIQSARKLGRSDLVETELEKLSTRFREWEANPEQLDAFTCHTVATYYLDVQPDTQRAIRYALLAVQKAPNDLAFRQTLGRVYHAAKFDAETIDLLTTATPLDARSALALADAQKSQGQHDAAIQTLTTAARFDSPDRREIQSALETLNAPVPPLTDLTRVKQRLTDFDPFPIRFASNPASAIEFTAQLDATAVEFGAPLRASLTLKNKGQNDIVLGPNRMLNPQVAVSLLGSSKLDPRLEGYLTIDLPGATEFKPQEVRRLTSLLTTTQGRQLLHSQPQRRMELTARFILDPVLSPDGTIAPRYPDIQPVDLKFMRTPIDATPEGLVKLREAQQSTDAAKRSVATETFVALILERYESMQRKPHIYRALPVDVAELTNNALTTLRDPDPIVRAKTIASLTSLPLDQAITQATAPRISDDHWLVRLLAIEFFAKKQGPVFLPVLEKLTNDPNPIVAKLATLYRDQAKQLKSQTRR